jgi:hypothetical protein
MVTGLSPARDIDLTFLDDRLQSLKACLMLKLVCCPVILSGAKDLGLKLTYEILRSRAG